MQSYGPHKADSRRVFTVGHSNRTQGVLVHLLHEAGVRAVVDVRRYPASRRYPQFNRDELATALLRKGIVYHHLGEALGGYRKEPYESHLLTEGFQTGLKKLEQLAAASSTAVLCAERNPDECHRRHIADCLLERGWEVVHLLGPEECKRHRPVDSQRRLF
jgi:uncharacterized protein (DUF488 family)